jgi:hypothetical protein
MTILAWTLPAGSSVNQGITAQELAGEVDKLFGKDIWFDVTDRATGGDYVVGPSGDWKLVGGREALRQSLIRRIITDPGEWQTLPDFGVGARAFVKDKNRRATRDQLIERIKSQTARDRRVESVDSVIVEFLEGGGLKIAVTVTAVGEALRNRPLTAAVEI